MGRHSAVLRQATVNLSSSSTTYGTLFGPAPERGTGLWHLIFHFDNGSLPVATGQPMRTQLLEGDGGKRGRVLAVRLTSLPGWLCCVQSRVWDPWGVNYYLSAPQAPLHP